MACDHLSEGVCARFEFADLIEDLGVRLRKGGVDDGQRAPVSQEPNVGRVINDTEPAG